MGETISKTIGQTAGRSDYSAGFVSRFVVGNGENAISEIAVRIFDGKAESDELLR